MLWHFKFLKLRSLNKIILKIKMSQNVTSFPWKDFKIFPFGMSQHFIYGPFLWRSGHGLSRYVTGCHSLSRDKLWQRRCYKSANITVLLGNKISIKLFDNNLIIKITKNTINIFCLKTPNLFWGKIS